MALQSLCADLDNLGPSAHLVHSSQDEDDDDDKGAGHSRLFRVLTSLIDIWDDIRELLLSNS